MVPHHCITVMVLMMWMMMMMMLMMMVIASAGKKASDRTMTLYSIMVWCLFLLGVLRTLWIPSP